jgi:hypothetical protein
MSQQFVIACEVLFTILCVTRVDATDSLAVATDSLQSMSPRLDVDSAESNTIRATIARENEPGSIRCDEGGPIVPAMYQVSQSNHHRHRQSGARRNSSNSLQSLPAGRRYYNGRYFGNFNNRFYGPQYGYF